MGGEGRSSLFVRKRVDAFQIHKAKLRHSHHDIEVNINAALTSALTIERNKTLTLRVEIFQKGDIAE